MENGIFITATGTDVGKTFVSAILVERMRNIGINCGYYKPVMSGTICGNDCQYVIDKANLGRDYEDLVSYSFKEPYSPHLAAKEEQVAISLDKIKEDYLRIKQQYEYLVVEGAGGVYTPLGEKLVLLDIIKELGLNVLLVADAGLGTINSTLLSIEYLKTNDVEVKGIIFNKFDKNNIVHTDNKKQVEKITGVRVVECIAG